MKQPKIKSCSIAIFASVLSGCGTLYKLDVTAFGDPNHELGRSYVILSSNPAIDMNSPAFETYAGQLERALAEKNYQRVSGENLENVALAVYLDADISDPEKRYHSVTTAMTEPSYDEAVTREANSGSGGQGGGGSPGQPTIQTQSVEPPPPEVLIGYEKQQFATTVYQKHLSIQAIDLQRYINDVQQLGRDKAVPHEVWSVDVETTGRPSELDAVVPIMIAAAQPYLGGGKADNVRVRMSDTNSQIQTIKGD
jgi:hypothetical protein